MEAAKCPNFDSCQLVIRKGFIGDAIRRSEYMDSYCLAGSSKWEICSRFLTHKALNFCPDFVLPDSSMSPDEVIDQFDRD